MKKTLSILLLCCTGCGNIGILSDDMQADGSYKIQSGGNIFATEEALRKEAYHRADGLCPKGYEIKSDTPIEHGRGSSKQLIVKCH